MTLTSIETYSLIQSNNHALFAHYLELGALPRYVNLRIGESICDDYPLLCCVAQYGNIAMLRELLDADWYVNNFRKKTYYLPLLTALKHNQVACANFLIQRNASCVEAYAALFKSFLALELDASSDVTSWVYNFEQASLIFRRLKHCGDFYSTQMEYAVGRVFYSGDVSLSILENQSFKETVPLDIQIEIKQILFKQALLAVTDPIGYHAAMPYSASKRSAPSVHKLLQGFNEVYSLSPDSVQLTNLIGEINNEGKSLYGLFEYLQGYSFQNGRGQSKDEDLAKVCYEHAIVTARQDQTGYFQPLIELCQQEIQILASSTAIMSELMALKGIFNRRPAEAKTPEPEQRTNPLRSKSSD